MINSTLPRLVAVVVTMSLAACGGGSGGGLLPPDPPTAQPSNAGGVWEGTISDTVAGTTANIAGAVTEANTEARFLTEDGVALVLENVSGNDGNLVADLVAFAPPGAVFSDGTSVSNGTLTGRVVERSSLTGDWTLATGDSGTVSLSYDAGLHQRASSLDFTAGIWLDSVNVIYTVDANGVLFGQDFIGCVFNGQVNLIDTRFNVYDLSITVTSCPGANGTYEGLGVLADEFGVDDAFIIQLDNGAFAIADMLLRP